MNQPQVYVYLLCLEAPFLLPAHLPVGCHRVPCAIHQISTGYLTLVAQMIKNPLQCGRPGFSCWVGKIPWRRERLPNPVFLPGQSHGQRSLAGNSPWGCKESDMTEQLSRAGHMLRGQGESFTSFSYGLWLFIYSLPPHIFSGWSFLRVWLVS